MNTPKLVIITTVVLFGSIAFLSLFHTSSEKPNEDSKPQEIIFEEEQQVLVPAKTLPVSHSEIRKEEKSSAESEVTTDVNRIEEFFNKKDPKFPIVETVTYKSRVPWQKGRPAWLSDYASHYKTSRHFIARSLNGSPDYLKQEIKEGDQFNVLKMDKEFEFYLVVDTSRCKMWFYYVDGDNHSKVLIKTYSVTLGRTDAAKTSGLLTPLGCYTLGDRTAVFKPGAKGSHHGKQIEMITVFGTRWIPFEGEVGHCTEPAKGFGIHGMPWIRDPSGKLIDKSQEVGKYASDGCLRLATEDMEELYAIIITRPTKIEIVHNFNDAIYRK